MVRCSLCAGARTLSTANNTNSNLNKHLITQHASIKLIAKEPSASSAGQAVGATPSKQRRLDFKRKPSQFVSQVELKRMIARYLVEDMQPLSTIESVAFRQLISKIPVTRDGGATMHKNVLQLPGQRKC